VGVGGVSRCVGSYWQWYQLAPLGGRVTCWLVVVVAQVRSVGWQLSGQGAGLAAEAGVVFVGAELGFDDEAAVGEERIVRTARIHVHTFDGQSDLTDGTANQINGLTRVSSRIVAVGSANHQRMIA